MKNIFKVTVTTNDSTDSLTYYGVPATAEQAFAAAGCSNVIRVEVLDMSTGELMLMFEDGQLTLISEDWIEPIFSVPLGLGAGD